MSRFLEDMNIADAWRRRLGLTEVLEPSGLESAGHLNIAVEDRIITAREAMMRLVTDQHGSELDLVDVVRRIEKDSREGVLSLVSRTSAPSDMQLSALEAVVAFDGTRPSFVIRQDRVDLESSSSTSAWKTTLSPRLEALARVAACVGCLEVGDNVVGTVFLVSPVLALTNRHVAQAIADIDEDGAVLRHEAYVDFGREDGGRESFDRREVLKVVFAGAQAITNTIDHGKLDIALLELSPSKLAGEIADRALPLDCNSALADNVTVAVIGYPGDWRRWVPPVARNAHADALAKLLGEKGGRKRLAPGASIGSPGSRPGPTTVSHDATTINGNSGSPLLLLQGIGSVPTIGLHYGGRWNGERANWSHLFSLCRDAPVMPRESFHESLRAHGIVR